MCGELRFNLHNNFSRKAICTDVMEKNEHFSFLHFILKMLYVVRETETQLDRHIFSFIFHKTLSVSQLMEAEMFNK